MSEDIKIEPNLCRTDDGLDTIIGKWKLSILLCLQKICVNWKKMI